MSPGQDLSTIISTTYELLIISAKKCYERYNLRIVNDKIRRTMILHVAPAELLSDKGSCMSDRILLIFKTI